MAQGRQLVLMQNRQWRSFFAAGKTFLELFANEEQLILSSIRKNDE